MSANSKENTLKAFISLGQLFAQPSELLLQAKQAAVHENPWFSPENIDQAFQGFAQMLQADALNTWFKEVQMAQSAKRVGLILAGNIPMVGLHDILCVLACGHIALIKPSSSDDKLIRAVLKALVSFAPALESHMVFVDRLKDFDAVIATGSNNSARYFDYYFSKVPHIIRKNRNSIALLDGKETTTELAGLSRDIFSYFGLGCRNVSKIWIPQDYDVKHFFEGIEAAHPIINHFKYQNNYDYNKSIYLVNGDVHFDNGFLLLKEDERLSSPLGVLYFQRYSDIDFLKQHIQANAENLQCVVTHMDIDGIKVDFGQSQSPKLWDYADQVNTLAFLNLL